MDLQPRFTADSKSFHVQRSMWRSILGKGGELHMELINTLVARLRKEEGQTMAEYAVVLGVITVLTVGVFITLSGAIEGAVNSVVGILP
jgi:Flp pilus assembly pilin Flp